METTHATLINVVTSISTSQGQSKPSSEMFVNQYCTVFVLLVAYGGVPNVGTAEFMSTTKLFFAASSLPRL